MSDHATLRNAPVVNPGTAPLREPAAAGQELVPTGPQPGTPPEGPSAAVVYKGKRAWFGRRTSLSLKLGLFLLCCYLLAAIVATFWTPYGATKLGAGPAFASPSSRHLMGTDQLGVDVFSQLLGATKLNVSITIAAVLIALVVGSFVGTVAGFYGGWLDTICMRLLEVLQSFPTLLLALLAMQALGSGTFNLLVIMSIMGVPEYMRLARSEVLQRKSWPFVEAARMSGARSWRVAFRHVFPNCTGPLIAFTSVNAAWVILLVSSLGYIGIGVEPGTPEWGAMISRGQNLVISGEWWVSFFPGLAIVGFTATLYLLGDALSDLMDPRRKS